MLMKRNYLLHKMFLFSYLIVILNLNLCIQSYAANTTNLASATFSTNNQGYTKKETTVPEKNTKQSQKVSRDKKSKNEWQWSGKFRTNSFFWDRKGCKDDYGNNFKRFSSDGTSLYDPRGFVAIVSLAVQTPKIGDWTFFINHFFGDNLGTLSTDDAKFARSGKDTFVRDRTSNEPKGFNTTAQFFAHYKKNDLNVKIGRFIFDSMLTHSNDTKAVPNTFAGFLAQQKCSKNSELTFAYIVKQKLRDRNTFHDILTYGTTEHDNDDSGAHRGLTRTRLDAEGLSDPKLLVLGWEGKCKVNQQKVFLYAVPAFFQTWVFENQWSGKKPKSKKTPQLKAGVRVLRQIDHGAGKIGGGKIDGTGTRLHGSLDATLWMARIQTAWHSSELTLGYSRVADRGDFVAPWRGFPTHGYTRTMTEVNWTAGTKSALCSWAIDLEKAGYLKGAKLVVNRAIHDRPESPGKISEDARVWHYDITYQIPKIDIEMKIRHLSHYGKAEQDFRDSRLEFVKKF